MRRLLPLLFLLPGRAGPGPAGVVPLAVSSSAVVAAIVVLSVFVVVARLVLPLLLALPFALLALAPGLVKLVPDVILLKQTPAESAPQTLRIAQQATLGRNQ